MKTLTDSDLTKKETLNYLISILAHRRHRWEWTDRTSLSKFAFDMEMRFEKRDNAAIELLNQLQTPPAGDQ